MSAVPWAQRYNAMRETVTALRALWSNHEAGFDGEFVNFESSWVYPKPDQAGGPPLLMGCQGRIGLHHAADEWCPIDIGFRDVGQGIGWFRNAVIAGSPAFSSCLAETLLSSCWVNGPSKHEASR